MVVVHNGIIENYISLRTELTAKGHDFVSDTDSEVIGHLCVEVMKTHSDPVMILREVLKALEGAYALAILIKDLPDCLLVARNASPLAIGLGEDACFVASDAMAMSEQTRRMVYLKDNDYAIVRHDGAEIYDSNDERVNREEVIISASPGWYQGISPLHGKEIHEQPDAIAHTLSAMTDASGKLTAGLSDDELRAMRGIVFLAAGTSHYASIVGRYWIEKIAGVPVSVEVASEYRYRQPASSHLSHAIAISQSGEP